MEIQSTRYRAFPWKSLILVREIITDVMDKEPNNRDYSVFFFFFTKLHHAAR